MIIELKASLLNGMKDEMEWASAVRAKKCPMATLITFSACSVVGILYLRSKKARPDVKQFLDWNCEDSPRIIQVVSTPKMSESTPATDSDGDMSLFRGLASLGMAPTSPKRGRASREAQSSLQHHPLRARQFWRNGVHERYHVHKGSKWSG